MTTALALARTSPSFIRKNFGVVLERTVRELNGEACIPMEDAPRLNSRFLRAAASGSALRNMALCDSPSARMPNAWRKILAKIGSTATTSPFYPHLPFRHRETGISQPGVSETARGHTGHAQHHRGGSEIPGRDLAPGFSLCKSRHHAERAAAERCGSA